VINNALVAPVLAADDSFNWEAALPLVGVVLGAAATGWVSWWFLRRTEGAAYRQARRLVAVELGQLAQDLGVVVRVQRLQTLDGFFETSVWRDQRGVLAKHLSDDDWEKVAVVFVNADGLRQLLGLNLGTTIPPSVVDRARRLCVGANESRVILGAPEVPVQGVNAP
jgi:hypothetical protein